MKVAVFGSHGFVGSHIVREAMRRGWSVNPIGSKTKNVRALIADSDAVVHSVGSFMPDKRYKKLVNEPISVCNVAQLASMKLGLSPSNPLNAHSFDELNFRSLKLAADEVYKTHYAHGSNTTIAHVPGSSKEKDLFPFVFISATDWGLADPEYIRSKRKAEAYLSSCDYLRPIFLRPGFIAPEPAVNSSKMTPRHLLDSMLELTDSPARVTVGAIAEAACDAIEDSTIHGAIESEVLQTLASDL